MRTRNTYPMHNDLTLEELGRRAQESLSRASEDERSLEEIAKEVLGAYPSKSPPNPSETPTPTKT